MSIDCETCDSTVFVPDSVWYAGTLFSPALSTLCGCCVSCIPPEARIPAKKLQPFAITFGVVLTECNSAGKWYHASNAKNGPARFSSSAEILNSFLPNSELFLKKLFPYYCIDTYIVYTVKKYLREKEHDPGAFETIVRKFLLYGDAIRAWFEWKMWADKNEIIIPLNKMTRAEAEKLVEKLAGRLGKRFT